MNDEAGNRRPLKLRAEDEQDLTVIAAALQSAVVRIEDITYRPRRRRFALMANRFLWENRTRAQRIRAGLRFDYVIQVQSTGIKRGARGLILELLTLTARALEQGEVEITLIFAGSAKLRLLCECIDCTLDDIGEPWDTASRPDHGIDRPAGDAPFAEK